MNVVSERWPVHPVSQDDETLSSWLLRVARANASSLSSWLAAIGFGYGDVLSLDTTEDRPLWECLARGGDVFYGADAVGWMTFVWSVRQLPPHAVSRWLLSIDDRVARAKHGYCPACLAEDQTPFLRGAWRMEWVRWCPTHKCRLEWSCRGCGAYLAPWKTSWQRPFTGCWSCGRDIARCEPQSEVAYAQAPAFVLEAIDRGVQWALWNVIPSQPRRPLLDEVWCLQKWAEQVGQESWPAWVVKLGIGTAQEATPPSPEDAVAWSFALAWHLATGPRARLVDLTLRHQATFNRATVIHCPATLRGLRHSVTVVRQVTSEDVEEVVASLVEGDMPVTYLAVAEALAVSPKFISRSQSLRAVVDRALPVMLERWCASMREQLAASRDRLLRRHGRLSRARLAEDAGVSLEAIARFERETGETFAVSPCETYEEKVKEAIEHLRGAGKRITTTAVCRELGRERSFIEKRPELKQLVAVARDARPTVEEVQAACRRLHADTNKAVTMASVARALGRARHLIERSETLKAAVETEKAVERRAVEAKIRAAIRALGEQGEEVSVVGVCRVMGKHRSYIEKRGRLREIVMRARRGT